MFSRFWDGGDRWFGVGWLGWRTGGRRRGRYWREPERLPGQEERDRELGRDEFYVYVLDTDYGHYVGHSWNVRARLVEHQMDLVPSTAGSAPELVWTSGRFRTRDDAARFEAALKSWRDQGSPEFDRVVGTMPEPFRNPAYGRGNGLVLLVGGAAVVAVGVVAFLMLA